MAELEHYKQIEQRKDDEGEPMTKQILSELAITLAACATLVAGLLGLAWWLLPGVFG